MDAIKSKAKLFGHIKRS